MATVLILVGIAGLALGGDQAVTGTLGIARRLHISPLVAGLTITSIGTSIPEIATNVSVAFTSRGGVDASGIAVGNVIGSCLSQITLLLGIAGMIATLTIPTRSLKRDGAMLVGALGLMLVVCIDGTVHQLEGAALVIVYATYLVLVTRAERGRSRPSPIGPAPAERSRLSTDLIRTAGGLTVVVVCADLVVDRGVEIASQLGVSDSLIGLLVGLGTGIPELTISLRAVREQQGELSLGNLLGSNITDPLLSFGLGASLSPVAVPAVALRFDFPWWGAGTLIAFLLLLNHRNLNRKESAILLVIFVLFAYVRLTSFGS